jgi:hypothetical protein
VRTPTVILPLKPVPEDSRTHRLASDAGASGIVLRVVCGWCPKVLREGVEPTSHGMCRECADRLTAEIRQRVSKCNGPTGACVLDLGHGGDHERG